MKKALFIDRDGTLLVEPADEQIDALEKFAFVPGAISGMKALSGLGYELVMVSNQDGLCTPAFPEETFLPCQQFLLDTLRGEGVVFDNILIDKSFPEDNAPTRKPRTGLLKEYMDGSYDLSACYVIGDRESDVRLAANLGAVGLQLGPLSWEDIVRRIRGGVRRVTVARKTAETDISVTVDLDGQGDSRIETGLHFFDHMLTQLVHHGGISLSLRCQGDLEVDEHHSVEDTAIVLAVDAVAVDEADAWGFHKDGYLAVVRLAFAECNGVSSCRYPVLTVLCGVTDVISIDGECAVANNFVYLAAMKMDFQHNYISGFR